MTAPADITGPEDLAKTVRSATDPLDEYPNYGTAANPPGDDVARSEEMSELIEARGDTAVAFGVACEQYIAAHPLRSVAVAAGAGAAAAALIIAVAAYAGDERR